MTLHLKRFYESEWDTLGHIFIGGVWICDTLEDEFREVKVAGETRIPAGNYRLILEHSPKFSVPERYNHRMLTIVGVPNFTGIRIHKGRRESHSEGCPLTGWGYRFLENGTAELQDPDKAYGRLYGIVAPSIERGEECRIIITDPEQDVPLLKKIPVTLA